MTGDTPSECPLVTVTGRLIHTTYAVDGLVSLAYVRVGEERRTYQFSVPVEYAVPTTTAEHVADDGTVRKSHYGPPGTRQPWDDIVDAGWAPHFAAANVLKYLRRDKAPEHSLESARWYWIALCRLGRDGGDRDRVEAALTVAKLMHVLTNAEFERLQGVVHGA